MEGRIALWRKIEAMSPTERYYTIPTRMSWDFSIDDPMIQLLGITLQTSLLFAGLLPDECHPGRVQVPEADQCDFWEQICRSWWGSKEWRSFRQQYLEDFPQCARCSEKAHSVHHKGNYHLSLTVISWGFLKLLDHPECFSSLCKECHHGLHRNVIEEKQRGVSDEVKAKASIYNLDRLLRKVKL